MATESNGHTFYNSPLIKWVMKTTGVKVEHLTKEGYCNDTIARVRAGRNVSVEKLFAITDRLGIIRKYLFDDGLRSEEQFAEALKPEMRRAA